MRTLQAHLSHVNEPVTRLNHGRTGHVKPDPIPDPLVAASTGEADQVRIYIRPELVRRAPWLLIRIRHPVGGTGLHRPAYSRRSTAAMIWPAVVRLRWVPYQPAGPQRSPCLPGPPSFGYPTGVLAFAACRPVEDRRHQGTARRLLPRTQAGRHAPRTSDTLRRHELPGRPCRNSEGWRPQGPPAFRASGQLSPYSIGSLSPSSSTHRMTRGNMASTYRSPARLG